MNISYDGGILRDSGGEDVNRKMETSCPIGKEIGYTSI